MLNVFQTLLLLYPAAHREVFGEEMAEVLAELRVDNANRKKISRIGFWIRETAGLLSGALAAHLLMNGPDGAFVFPIGRLTMRNGFRFPKSTAVLMVLILAALSSPSGRVKRSRPRLPRLANPLRRSILPTRTCYRAFSQDSSSSMRRALSAGL